ncbi:MAG TPA: hypothetical protein VNZ01_14760 [Solirubrobacteraceae bacterium]|nr:hypothetical protein [Solirubrobacteraceae bacterium]
MCDSQLYCVEVTDYLVPALVGNAGFHYESPAQDEQQARALVRVLLGSSHTPAGAGPWQHPVPGGRRRVALRRAG